jgi:hypothetical protein
MERLAKVLNVVILGLGGWDSATVEEIKKQGVDPWFYADASLNRKARIFFACGKRVGCKIAGG